MFSVLIKKLESLLGVIYDMVTYKTRMKEEIEAHKGMYEFYTEN